jgi:hypothetical protein
MVQSAWGCCCQLHFSLMARLFVAYLTAASARSISLQGTCWPRPEIMNPFAATSASNPCTPPTQHLTNTNPSRSLHTHTKCGSVGQCQILLTNASAEVACAREFAVDSTVMTHSTTRVQTFNTPHCPPAPCCFLLCCLVGLLGLLQSTQQYMTDKQHSLRPSAE